MPDVSRTRTALLSSCAVLLVALVSGCGGGSGGGDSAPSSAAPALTKPDAMTHEAWLAEWTAKLPITATLTRQIRHRYQLFMDPQRRPVYTLRLEIKNDTGHTIDAGDSVHVVETATPPAPGAKPGPAIQIDGATFDKTPAEDYSGASEFLSVAESTSPLLTLVLKYNTWDSLGLRNAQSRRTNGGYVRLLATYIEQEEGKPGQRGLAASYGSAGPGAAIAIDTEMELWVTLIPKRLDQAIVISPLLRAAKTTTGGFRYLLTFKKPAEGSNAWQLDSKQLVPMTADGLRPLIMDTNAPMWRRAAAASWADDVVEALEADLVAVASEKASGPVLRSAALATLAGGKRKAGAAPATAILADRTERADLREQAARVLGVFGDRSGAPVLLSVLDEKADDVAGRAAESLGDLGEAAAVEPLFRILENNARKGPHYFAARALARLVDRTGFDRLMKIAHDPKAQGAEAVVSALEVVKLPEAATAMLEFSQSTSPKLRAAVCGALAKSSSADLRAKLKGLREDASADVRSAAAEATSRLENEQEKVSGLREALQSKYPEVAILAAQKVGLGQAPALVAEVSALLSKPETNVKVRAAAVDAFKDLRDPATIDAIVVAARDKDTGLRVSALEALGVFRDPRVLDTLLPALAEKDADVRKGAAKGLANARDPKAVDALIALVTRVSDGEDREEATRALGMIGDPRATETLVALVREDVANYSYPAAEALERVTGQSFGQDGAAWARWWKGQQGR